MAVAHVATRVVLVAVGASSIFHFAGVVIEERQERYLALEGDPTRTPLGPRSIGF